SREGHDVALIDRDPQRISEAEERLDVQFIVGRGTSPSILEQAGVTKAGLVVAVTNNDEANLISALIAKQAGVETTVVRLQADALRGAEGSRLRKAMG